MKLWSLLLLLSAPAWAAGKYETKPMQSHTGGLDTYHSPNTLKEDQASVAINCLFDRDNAVTSRRGYETVGTVTNCTSNLRGGWSFKAPGGTQYYMVACSSNIFSSSGGSYSIQGGSISATQQVRASATLGKIWFTDLVDSLWNTDGVTISSAPAAPLCELVGGYKSRLVLANCSGAKSTINLSGYQDGTNYTIPVVQVDTAPAQFFLNGPNDGREVTCLFDGFKDQLILWNEDNTYSLTGNGNSSFILRVVAQGVGCIEQETVQEHGGRLRWLSKRGVEEYDGANLRRISLPVQDLMDTVVGTQRSVVTLTHTTQADWQAGNVSASGQDTLSTLISPGNVVPSTWGVNIIPVISSNSWEMVDVDTSIVSRAFWDDFNDGDTTANPVWTINGSTIPTPPVFYNDILSTSAIRPAYGDGTGTLGLLMSAPQTDSTGTWSVTWVSTQPGGWSMGLMINASNAEFIHATGYRIFVGEHLSTNKLSCNITAKYYSPSQAVSLGSAVYDTIDPNDGQVHTARITRNSNGYMTCSVDDVLISSATDLSISSASVGFIFSHVNENPTTGGGATSYSKFRFPGFYEHQVSVPYKVSVATPVYGPYAVTLSSSSDSSVLFKTQTSTAQLGGYTTLASISVVGDKIQQDQKRWVRHHVHVQAPVTSTTSFTLPQRISLQAATTGYYVDQCFNPGTFNSWGLFQANTVTSGGNFTFEVSTGATCHSVTVATAPWTTQANNTNITVPVAAYLGVRPLFTLNAGTQTVSLQDISINYVPSAARPYSATAVHEYRYWLAFTTNTASGAYNDTVLVYDQFGKWSMFKGINAGSLWLYNRKLYSGSSTGNGKVYQQDKGFSDDGSSILFVFKTPFYDLSYPGYKSLRWLKTDMAPTTDVSLTGSLNVNYYVDQGTTSYSLGSISSIADGSFIQDKKYFSQNGFPSTVRSLAYEYKSESVTPFKIFRSALQYMIYKERD